MSPNLIISRPELPEDPVDQPARETIPRQDDYKDEEEQEAIFEEIKGPLDTKDFQAYVIYLHNFTDLLPITPFFQVIKNMVRQSIRLTIESEIILQE